MLKYPEAASSSRSLQRCLEEQVQRKKMSIIIIAHEVESYINFHLLGEGVLVGATIQVFVLCIRLF